MLACLLSFTSTQVGPPQSAVRSTFHWAVCPPVLSNSMCPCVIPTECNPPFYSFSPMSKRHPYRMQTSLFSAQSHVRQDGNLPSFFSLSPRPATELRQAVGTRCVDTCSTAFESRAANHCHPYRLHSSLLFAQSHVQVSFLQSAVQFQLTVPFPNVITSCI